MLWACMGYATIPSFNSDPILYPTYPSFLFPGHLSCPSIFIEIRIYLLLKCGLWKGNITFPGQHTSQHGSWATANPVYNLTKTPETHWTLIWYSFVTPTCVQVAHLATVVRALALPIPVHWRVHRPRHNRNRIQINSRHSAWVVSTVEYVHTPSTKQTTVNCCTTDSTQTARSLLDHF